MVTSDRALGQGVRTRGGAWLSCARFRGELERAAGDAEPGSAASPPAMTEAEMNEWLRAFGGEDDDPD